MGVVMRFSRGTAEALPTPAPKLPFATVILNESNWTRPWRMCSWRTAGRTPPSCGRSSAAPRSHSATIQVGASPSPQSTQHPTPSTSLSPHPGCMGGDGHLVHCAAWPTAARLATGARHFLPAPPSHLLFSRSYAVASSLKKIDLYDVRRRPW